MVCLRACASGCLRLQKSAFWRVLWIDTFWRSPCCAQNWAESELGFSRLQPGNGAPKAHPSLEVVVPAVLSAAGVKKTFWMHEIRTTYQRKIRRTHPCSISTPISLKKVMKQKNVILKNPKIRTSQDHENRGPAVLRKIPTPISYKSWILIETNHEKSFSKHSACAQKNARNLKRHFEVRLQGN